MKGNKNIWRMLLQLGLLGGIILLLLVVWFRPSTVIDFEAYCPFGGFQAFLRYAEAGSLACSMTTTQIFVGLALLGGILIFSKLFCGYLCPLGTIGEWLGKLGDRLKVKVAIPTLADKALRSLKYLLAFATIYFTVSSGELFCKQYDPFFATVSGFNSDVVVTYAIIAIILLLVGSIFIRQFWCRYFCPMGAVSNIFSFFGLTSVLVLGFLVLIALNINVGWTWLLAACCIGGYILEIAPYRRKVFPLIKVTKNDSACSGCKLCDRACPQGIKVSEVKGSVTCIDCNLCGECVTACKKEQALGYNGKRKLWIPALATVALVFLGIVWGSITEVPTIDERWGSAEEVEQASVYVQDKMDNVKCYGSSMAFASQMHKVKGVLGVKTYVGSHHVKIYYNPDIIAEKDLKRAIYAPFHSWINRPKMESDTLRAVVIGVNNFYGRNDYVNFLRLMKPHKGVYGYETEWGEPVLIRVFYNPQTFSVEELPGIISSPTLTYTEGEGDAARTVTTDLDYKFEFLKPGYETFTKLQVEQRWFKPFEQEFKAAGSYNLSNTDSLAVFLPQAKSPVFARPIMYLASHLSNDSTIVSFKTRFSSSNPEGVVVFLKGLTSKDKVLSLMRADTLTIRFTNGSVKKIENQLNVLKEKD